MTNVHWVNISICKVMRKETRERSALDFTVKRIASADFNFRKALDLLKENFPPALLGDVDSFKEFFDQAGQEAMTPDRFFFIVAKDDKNQVVGMAIFNYLDRPAESNDPIGSGVAYLEYIAVAPYARRLKLASRLYWECIQAMNREGYSPSAFIAEVAKMDEDLGLSEESVSGRLKFFSGLGAKVVQGIDYKMPTFTHKREIPAYLLVRPLKADFQFDLWFVRGVVYALVYDVFRYDREISETRADQLYQSIVASIDRGDLSLIKPVRL